MLIGFGGDLVVQELPGEPVEIFKEFVDWTYNANIRVCLNLESPFIEKDNLPVKNKLTLGAHADSVRYINYLYPYLLNLANNHINDFGTVSVDFTMDLLEQNSHVYFGVGDARSRNNLYKDEANKILFIAYVTRSTDFTGSPLFAGGELKGGYEPDPEEVKRLRKEYPDWNLVVNIHWGIEDVYWPEPEKKELGHQLIDCGADLIIGHHPHIIQPYEEYCGKFIFYSLGNFYFPIVHYKTGEVMKEEKLLPHQREGLFPVLDIKPGKIVLKEILLVVNQGGLYLFPGYRLGRMLKCPASIYSFYYKLYMLGKKLKRVCRNPELILRKYFKLN